MGKVDKRRIHILNASQSKLETNLTRYSLIFNGKTGIVGHVCVACLSCVPGVTVFFLLPLKKREGGAVQCRC